MERLVVAVINTQKVRKDDNLLGSRFREQLELLSSFAPESRIMTLSLRYRSMPSRCHERESQLW